MSSLLLFGLCFTFLLLAACGLYSTDHEMMAVSPGQSITLPCGLPSVKSCSSINWTMEGQMKVWLSEVVTDGRLMSSEGGKFHLLQNCSLKIAHVQQEDARQYTCSSGTLSSSVSLRILELSEALAPAEGTVELQCVLNTFKGYASCNNSTGMHIRWTSQEDAPLKSKRFRFEDQSACFSKLIIRIKPTDHHRTWRCHVTQNNEVKASVSYETTVEGGLEEVFAAVGESVSLACRNTSSLRAGVDTKWNVRRQTPTHMSSGRGQTEAVYLSKGLSLLISKLSPLQAGDYQCVEASDQQNVFNTVRLHTLHVTARREDLTLTCVLTCAEDCEENFNLTWSAADQAGWRCTSTRVNNTLTMVLLLPAWPDSSDEMRCSVYKEGSLVASRKWHSDTFLQKLAWLGLLGLLVCAAAGGLYMHKKRKQNKDAANKQPSITMAHVYDIIQDEEVQKKSSLKKDVPTTDDGLYNLLQAVN